MTLVTLTVFFFPTVIIAACYAVIVYTIWSKGKVMTITTKALGPRSKLDLLSVVSESREWNKIGRKMEIMKIDTGENLMEDE